MLPLNQKRMFTTATNSGYCVLPTQIVSQILSSTSSLLRPSLPGWPVFRNLNPVKQFSEN